MPPRGPVPNRYVGENSHFNITYWNDNFVRKNRQVTLVLPIWDEISTDSTPCYNPEYQTKINFRNNPEQVFFKHQDKVNSGTTSLYKTIYPHCSTNNFLSHLLGTNTESLYMAWKASFIWLVLPIE